MSERFTITIHDAGTIQNAGRFSCEADERVVTAMERQIGLSFTAANGKRIPVGCRRGGCGVCRVEVLEGAYRTDPMSRTHVSDSDERQRIVLACCLYPLSNLSLRLRPKAAAVDVQD